MRLAAKKDANQDDIVDMLRDFPGVSVHITHQLGGGFPDLCVGFKGHTLLVELKNPDYATELQRGKPEEALTDDEKNFRDGWRGSYLITYDIDPILDWLKGLQ